MGQGTVHAGQSSILYSVTWHPLLKVNKKGLVLKPIQNDKRGQRELQFFKTVFSSEDESVKTFLSFIPHFHGSTKKTKSDGGLQEFIMMENLTNNFSKACIMDVKIGAKTYGPDATPEKMKQQDASYAGTKVILISIN